MLLFKWYLTYLYIFYFIIKKINVTNKFIVTGFYFSKKTSLKTQMTPSIKFSGSSSYVRPHTVNKHVKKNICKTIVFMDLNYNWHIYIFWKHKWLLQLNPGHNVVTTNKLVDNNVINVVQHGTNKCFERACALQLCSIFSSFATYRKVVPREAS